MRSLIVFSIVAIFAAAPVRADWSQDDRVVVHALNAESHARCRDLEVRVPHSNRRFGLFLDLFAVVIL